MRPTSPTPSETSQKPNETSFLSSSHFDYTTNLAQQEFHERILKPHIEITLLNEIYHVIPKDSFSLLRRRGELLSLVIDMMKTNFVPQNDKIQSWHLVNVDSKELVERDDQISQKNSYFMAGWLKPSADLIQHYFLALRDKESDLFARRDKQFTVKKVVNLPKGKVEILRLARPEGSRSYFQCPVIQCGKEFHRSCDLYAHYVVEIDAYPHQCLKCEKKFRRLSLLNKHLKLSQNCKRDGQSKEDDSCEIEPKRPNLKEQVTQEALEQIEKNNIVIKLIEQARVNKMPINSLLSALQIMTSLLETERVIQSLRLISNSPE